MPAHSSASGTDLHEAKRLKEPVRAASTANVTLATPGASLDGVTLSNGDRILLKNQSTGSQNGLYTWSGAASALVRTVDADAAVDFVSGFMVYVSEGTTNGTSFWAYTTAGAITLGTTSLAFAKVSASGAFSGEVSATDFSATGLTGATSGTRYVGATSSGPPTSGTFAIGDVVESRTDGAVWTCITAGSPGTWKKLDVNPMTAVGDLIIGGTVANGYAAAARLAADTAGKVLTANGAGVAPSWQAATGGSGGSSGGGGSGALSPIGAPVGPLTAAQTTITFTGIPQTGFRNLRLVVVGRSTAATTTASVQMQFNNDTGSNYDYEDAQSNASSTSASNSAAAQTSGRIGYVPGTSASSGTQAGNMSVDILNYVGTTYQKQYNAHGGVFWGTSTSSFANDDISGQWRSAVAISSITLTLASGDFDVGSYACLYGLMDSAGVLLTPASNLLVDVALAGTTTTFNIPGGYTDLMIVAEARSDTAATTANLHGQVNSDTGSNYDGQYTGLSNGGFSSSARSAADTKMLFGVVTAASILSNAPTGVTILVPNYLGTTYHKTFITNGTLKDASNLVSFVGGLGYWRSTAAIVSMTLSLSAGSFVTGSRVRVYGLPAASGGASVGTGTRLRISANQSIADSTDVRVNWDVEDVDADQQHYTSSANLTGTVAKNATATLTGTSTAFLTELSIGQVISVPGTSAEKRVVVAIASNTSLTVSSPFTFSASGQTAARVNSAVVIRNPGWYNFEFHIYMAPVATGQLLMRAFINGSTSAVAEDGRAGVNNTNGYALSFARQLQQWDFVEVGVNQTSGGPVNLQTDERTNFEINARPTIIVAVPYVCIRDEKSDGTSGGAFTSGAWRTRDLNTEASDESGIASIASNQVTLAPGVYRTRIDVPGFQVGDHQSRLRNITAGATLLVGQNARSGDSAPQSPSTIAGRFRLTVASALEVQHWCETTNGTNGFGRATNFTSGEVEVYTVAEFWKEG